MTNSDIDEIKNQVEGEFIVRYKITDDLSIKILRVICQMRQDLKNRYYWFDFPSNLIQTKCKEGCFTFDQYLTRVLIHSFYSLPQEKDKLMN